MKKNSKKICNRHLDASSMKWDNYTTGFLSNIEFFWFFCYLKAYLIAYFFHIMKSLSNPELVE